MKLTSLILSITLALSVFFVEPEQVLAAAPTDYVSCWELDESSTGVGAVTRVDANTTNSNDLTDNNTTASAAGKISNGADFESTNSEYLNITDANQVGLDITGDLSFATWVYLESDFSANGGAMMYKWGSGSASYGLVYTDISTVNKIRFQGYVDGSNNIPLDWTYTLNTATWYHIVFRLDVIGHASGNGTGELFINGTSQGTVTNTSLTSLFNGTGAFSLSSLGSGVQWYWDGLEDISEIYNRLLTNAEITALYNSGAGVACTGRSAGGGGSTGYTITNLFQ